MAFDLKRKSVAACSLVSFVANSFSSLCVNAKGSKKDGEGDKQKPKQYPFKKRGEEDGEERHKQKPQQNIEKDGYEIFSRNQVKISGLNSILLDDENNSSEDNFKRIESKQKPKQYPFKKRGELEDEEEKKQTNERKRARMPLAEEKCDGWFGCLFKLKYHGTTPKVGIEEVTLHRNEETNSYVREKELLLDKIQIDLDDDPYTHYTDKNYSPYGWKKGKYTKEEEKVKIEKIHKWLDGDGEALTDDEYEARVFISGGGCYDGHKFYKNFTN